MFELPVGMYTFRYSDDSLNIRDTQLLKSAPLPVNDLVVKASWNGNVAVINWSTSAEVNTASYVLQRSVNGINFSVVATVKAAGTTSSLSTYAFSDKAAAALTSKIVYYRLQLNDIDGRQKFSSVVKLQSAVKGMSLVLNPNPARGSVTLSVASELATAATIEVRNTIGQLVKKQSAQLVKGTNTLRVALGGLAKGEYFISLNSGDKTVQEKLIVY